MYATQTLVSLTNYYILLVSGIVRVSRSKTQPNTGRIQERSVKLMKNQMKTTATINT